MSVKWELYPFWHSNITHAAAYHVFFDLVSVVISLIGIFHNMVGCGCCLCWGINYGYCLLALRLLLIFGLESMESVILPCFVFNIHK